MNSFVHRAATADAVDVAGAALGQLGYLIRRVDAGAWRKADDMHDELSVIFGFPDYYGRSLDALHDVMSDVAMYECGSDPKTTGTVLLLPGFSDFYSRDARAAQALLDIWANKARMAAVASHPMLCVVEQPDWELSPVGATPVMPIHPGRLGPR